MDGTTVNYNGKGSSPPNEEDMHRYVTDDAPRAQKVAAMNNAIRGSGSTTNAAGLIVGHNPWHKRAWRRWYFRLFSR